MEYRISNFRPRGVRIFVGYARHTGRRVASHYSATIKSKGRTGARARQRLMGMNDAERQYVLEPWANGKAATSSVWEGL